jgi:prephenate dehydrogenase
MAGSGFEYRVLLSSPAMWTPISSKTRSVIETLEEYISNLTHFKDLLKEDYDAIYEEMQSVNKIKGILNGNEH